MHQATGFTLDYLRQSTDESGFSNEPMAVFHVVKGKELFEALLAAAARDVKRRILQRPDAVSKMITHPTIVPDVPDIPAWAVDTTLQPAAKVKTVGQLFVDLDKTHLVDLGARRASTRIHEARLTRARPTSRS